MNETLERLQLIKKNAVILILLHKADQPLTGKQAGLILGMDHHTAIKHLEKLRIIGMVEHHGKFKGYSITDRAIDLIYDQNVVLSHIFPTTAAINKDNNINELEKTEAQKENGINPHFQKNKDLLKSCGVGKSSLAPLADLDHVNPDYLKAHIEKWRKEKKGAGLLITRIRDEDPAPEAKNDDRKKYRTPDYD